MAVVGGVGLREMPNLGGGPLGTVARGQYRALAQMRWRMFQNGLRSNQGVLELGARTFSFIVYALMGLGLSLGLGAGAYAMVSRNMWPYVPVLLWVVFIFWQALPVLLSSFQEQFDMTILLRFPVGFWSFNMLYLIFGLVDVSTITCGACCFGLWVGITLARPELFGWVALGLVAFAGFNILLARAIFAWIDRWLAQRRTREIVGALFFISVLSLQLLNPALRVSRQSGNESREDRAASVRRMTEAIKPWLEKANEVQGWLPPGLATSSFSRAGGGRPVAALGSLSLLGLYVLAAGGVLAWRLRAEYAGENLGEAPRAKKLARRDRAWLLDGSGPIAAVMEKELRALLRTLPLIYAIGAPLLLVLVFSGVFVKSASRGHAFALALPVCMVYAQLGFTQLFYNNLGAEGPAIQLYFLSPTPIRTTMLAKNIFHSLLFALVALQAGILTSLRLGTPDTVVIAATVAWLLFSLPSNLAAGNIFSLTMPYRINPGRITRQRGSQANALLSLLVQLGVLGIGATVFALCWVFGHPWLAVPIFLVLAVIAFQVWWRVLRNADTMANQRRDALIGTLAKTE